MEFLKNTLLEWQTAEEQVQIDCVVWVELTGERLCLIRLNDECRLPRLVNRSELEARIATGDLAIIKSNPFAKLHRPEYEIPEEHKRIRDRRWEIIQPLLQLPPGDVFDPEIRSRVIKEICSKHRISSKTPYKLLRLFWQRGQVKNSLLPDYPNCGGKHKERRCSEHKRGRPNKTRERLGLAPGINIGPEEKKKIMRGIQLFYLKGKQNTVEAHRLTAERFFHKGPEFIDGKPRTIPPSPDEAPSVHQFRYYIKKLTDPTKAIVVREGAREFNLHRRPLLGDAMMMAFGPGIYQMDATILDVWLVHILDRARLVGKPTLYLIKDVFSRIIPGFALSFENPSYVSAMVALFNAAEDKVLYCASQGIEITADQWPAQDLPELVVADRGELAGLQTDHLAKELNIRISNAAPYRPDMKGIIERGFRSFEDDLVHGLPGAVKGRRERGEPDPRLEACLDIQEVRNLVIHKILDHNRSRMNSYRLQDYMIADHVEPIPNLLWQYGIRYRTGHMHKAINPDVLRLTLLPHDEASVTRQGIYFRGVYFSCERALREQWFVRAQNGRWKEPIAFDPRNSDEIFLRRPGENSIERCCVLEKDARFKGASWKEVDEFYAWQNEGRERFEPEARRLKAAADMRRDQIVPNAQEQAKAARKGMSQRAFLQGVRENRVEARELDRPNQQLAPAPADLAEPGAILSLVNHGTSESGSEGYVPAPSSLEKLRQKRDEEWSQNEK